MLTLIMDGAKSILKKSMTTLLAANGLRLLKVSTLITSHPSTASPSPKSPNQVQKTLNLHLMPPMPLKTKWNAASPTERSNLLLKIADRLEQNIELSAVAETWENGKPIRETLAADIPFAIDHFRYFAGRDPRARRRYFTH